MPHNSNFDEFISWHDEFIGQKKFQLSGYQLKDDYYKEAISYYNYRPKNIKAWIDRIDENHQDLREAIGGIRKSYQISIQAGETPSNMGDCGYIISNILHYLPKYLSEYKLKVEDLSSSQLAKHKNISTTKHILGYVKRQGIIDVYQLKYINMYCEQLGRVYATRKYPESKFDITFSTDPRSFALIGAYRCGTDRSSCFSQVGMNCDKKYAVAATENSFMYLIRQSGDGDKIEVDSDPTVLGRGIGFFTEKMKVMNVCNSSFGSSDCNGIKYTAILHGLGIIAQGILKTKNIGYVSGHFEMKGGCNYIGQHIGSWWDKDKRDKINKQNAVLPMEYSKEAHPKGDTFAGPKH